MRQLGYFYTVNTLFPVVNFLHYVVTEVVFFKTLTFPSDTLEVWWDL